jgi:hypothetical protein
MAYMPSQNKIPFKIKVIDGGLNTKYADLNTPANQSPDLQNVYFDDYGAVGTVYGYTPLNTTPISSHTIDGMHEYVSSGSTRTLIAACGGSLHQWETNTFTAVTGSTGIYTAGTRVNFVTVNEHAYVVSPSMNPYRYDDTGLYRVGVSGATAEVASAKTSAFDGTLSGLYRWALTGVNSQNVESDYSIITTTFTAASAQVTLTDIPVFSDSFGVDIKYLYRSTAAGGSIFYRVTALTAAQTGYTDNAADTSLLVEAPEDNGVPPQMAFILEHRNRVFGAGNTTYQQRLYYSNQGNTQVWESTSYIDIGEGDGEPITGLAVYGNSIFIHKNDGKGHGSIWGLYMPDSLDVATSENWYVSKLAVAEGGAGHRSIVAYNNAMAFINRYGAYSYYGEGLAKSPAYGSVGVFPVNAISFLIEPDWKEFRDVMLSGAAATNFENKLWFAVPKGSTAAKNNHIYIYDYVRASNQGNDITGGAWTRLDNPPVSCFGMYDGDLYGGSADQDGYVYKLNTGRTQSGGAIDSYYYTVWLWGKDEHKDNTKVWRYLYLWVETSGTWNLNVNYWVDFEQNAGETAAIDLSSGGNAWNTTMIWDKTPFGGGSNKKLMKIVLRGAVGKTIQFKFWTNTADQHFKIHEMQLNYNLRSIRD